MPHIEARGISLGGILHSPLGKSEDKDTLPNKGALVCSQGGHSFRASLTTEFTCTDMPNAATARENPNGSHGKIRIFAPLQQMSHIQRQIIPLGISVKVQRLWVQDVLRANTLPELGLELIER